VISRKKKKTDTAKALKEALIVRHRAPGHVRFQLPASLCRNAVAEVLEKGLLGREGIYRVVVYKGSCKLSIRYTEGITDLAAVARTLGILVDKLAERGIGLDSDSESEKTKKQRTLYDAGDWFKELKPVRWVNDKVEMAKAYGRAYTEVVTYKVTGKSKLPVDVSDWTISFLNDLVVFYLIKVHWERMTNQWLRAPWAHRYHWLTVFYLVFLLTRHRKKSSK